MRTVFGEDLRTKTVRMADPTKTEHTKSHSLKSRERQPTMAAKMIAFDQEARQAMQRGVAKLARPSR